MKMFFIFFKMKSSLSEACLFPIFQHVVGPLVKAVMCDLKLTNQKAGKDSYDNTVLDGGNKELPKIGAKHSLDLSKRKRLDLKLSITD